YLSEGCLPHGNSIDDAEWFGVELARAGVDYLSLSRGGKFEDAKQPKVGRAVYPYTGPSGFECMPTAIADERGPFGRKGEAGARSPRPVRAAGGRREAGQRVGGAVRAAGLATPTLVAGGICTFEQAEGILERGEADVV